MYDIKFYMWFEKLAHHSKYKWMCKSKKVFIWNSKLPESHIIASIDAFIFMSLLEEYRF